jgi:hypothetical protein
MGCCHNRSSATENENKQIKENIFDYQTEDSSSEVKGLADTTLIEYLKICKQKHNWEVVCSLITNKQVIFDVKSSPS